MSDNHIVSQPQSSPSSPTIGEVNHLSRLSEHFAALYLSDEYSDVSLIIEKNHLPAHRVVLAARSNYFRALLYNGMKESTQNEIEIKVSSIAAFKFLLKYVYSGHMQLGSFNDEMVLEIFGLAHQFGYDDLESSICDYLKATLNIHNVCMIYDAANLYQLTSLADVCQWFIDRHALDVIKHESFYSLSAPTLKEMISRDSFCAPEIEIFKAIHEWTLRNATEDTKDIIESIRLSLISTEDLLTIVRNSGLVTADDILDAIHARNQSRDVDLKYRGCLIIDENVASKRHNAQVIYGEKREDLLDGNFTQYDMEKGFTRHHIDDNNGQGILIKLGMQFIVNHIQMLLWDKDMRAYSFYIEMSMDAKDWVRVIDHSQYLCRSWQYLYFPQRVARYIRIVGTHNTVNRVFHLVSFDCMYTLKKFEVDRGLLVPDYNCASINYSACVIEGVSRSRNTLINGDWNHYDWDTGYTCHQLGSGAIVVQLSQPYMIDSMRLLLWDTDERTYSYYIEVSIDQQHWDIVADKRTEQCRSWQILRFERRPVVFIRIVGTYNSANEVFHCVHFECPSQISENKKDDDNDHDDYDDDTKNKRLESVESNHTKETENQLNQL